MSMGLTILILLIVGVGAILLQIYLSKQSKKWFGLMLPALSFIASLMLVISIIAYKNIGISTQSYSNDGTIVSFEIEDTRSDFNTVVRQVVTTFLISNVFTVVLIVIYIACRGKRKRRLEIEKMQIQDLE